MITAASWFTKNSNIHVPLVKTEITKYCDKYLKLLRAYSDKKEEHNNSHHHRRNVRHPIISNLEHGIYFFLEYMLPFYLNFEDSI